MNQQTTNVSSLFDRQETKKVFTIIGFTLLVFVGLGGVIAPFMFRFWPEFQIAINALGLDLKLLIQDILIFGIGFVLFFLVIRKVPKESINKEKIGFGRLIKIFIMTYPFTFVGAIIGDYIERAISTNMTTAENIHMISSSGSIVELIGSVVIAPIVEELIFRKMLIDRTKRYGEKTAIVFSALCFGFMHMSIPQILYATCTGCFFGYVYSKSGKIHYTIIMHAVLNGIACISSITEEKSERMLSLSSEELQDVLSTGNFTVSEILSMFILIAIFIIEIVFFILGIIFLITRARKVRFVETSPYCIPKKQRFITIASSGGMILFFVVCIGMTIFHLLI